MNKSGKKVRKKFSEKLAQWFVPFLASAFFMCSAMLLILGRCLEGGSDKTE